MKILPLLVVAVSLFLASHVPAADPKPAGGAKAAAAKDVTPDEAAELMKDRARVLVIDVRTSDEFAEGHIAGAKNVDFLGDDFEKMIATLPKDKALIIHCASGNRSARAVTKIAEMQRSGQIFHLKSGFNGWVAAGKPIEGVKR